MAANHDSEPHEAQAALAMIERALVAAFSTGDGAITASTETQIQNGLHQLRQAGCDKGIVLPIERIAANVRLMLQAKRSGLCNLYDSKLLQVRRQLAV